MLSFKLEMNLAEDEFYNTDLFVAKFSIALLLKRAGYIEEFLLYMVWSNFFFTIKDFLISNASVAGTVTPPLLSRITFCVR